MSKIPLVKDVMMIDVVADALGCKVSHFIMPDWVWDREKLRTICHRSRVEAIYSIPIPRRYGEDMIL